MKSRYLWSTKSLLHNLEQVRLESVPAGESWSVERQEVSAMIISSQIPHFVDLLYYLDRWLNDWELDFTEFVLRHPGGVNLTVTESLSWIWYALKVSLNQHVKHRHIILMCIYCKRSSTCMLVTLLHCINIWVTSTIFWSSQLHACCVWYITNFKGGYQPHFESECSWEASPFIKLSLFRRLLAYLARLVFLWSYTSAPGGVPWLHDCGKNVTKYL